jgi:hypothetical protein
MISEENVRYLKEAGRRYIVGTPKGMLKRFERELLAQDWHQVHAGQRRRSWNRVTRIFKRWIPAPRVLHPYPTDRFLATHPRWEPYA